MKPSPDYASFLKTVSAPQWRRIGTKRRAGIAVPLFSVYSKKSAGIGEIPDLKLLAGWCRSVGMSLVQLLPLNDTGTHFRPYDAESAFALDPAYLSLDEILFVPKKAFAGQIASLRKKFAVQDIFFDTTVKKAKLSLLRKMFAKRRKEGESAFRRFKKENEFWLAAYACFKILKERMNQKAWEEWPEEFRSDAASAIRRLSDGYADEIEFHSWLQWQLFSQMTEARKYAAKQGVYLLGDLPFLASRDSADVWANPSYFKLDRVAGAPPDFYHAGGQRWGMPPYDWRSIAAAGYDYLARRLRYAESFYDLFRVDHFVGIFRVWTFPAKDGTDGGSAGASFDPADENLWEEHGRRILSAILKSTKMLPCAEDLGTVPDCSYRVLAECAIPGMDVQRWARHWKTTGQFKSPGEYRPHSVAVISTHDMASLAAWWEAEATAEDKEKFWRFLGIEGPIRPEASTSFVEKCLEAAHAAASIFSIQLFQDWLSLGGNLYGRRGPEARINTPGVVDEKNWRLRMPVSLEELRKLPLNRTILRLNRAAGRI